MKKIESNSMFESFGLSTMDTEELFSVNGGIKINTGICKNFGPILPPLSGMIVGPITKIDLKPIIEEPIPVPAPIVPKPEVM